ncbi:YqaJ viral recombinase family protein [Elizabethkingia anophelis]|nr:YqaJ viral recombinase family protein [Elizabethkingia anophelis]MCT4239399.1 YqaJ viral recombinase family protein [Elizabethkingia anophelis]MCT4282030.1 YqaJ viral recombinase family protein [Elizabethkingia anophelis]MCT4292615.1 YqaJ viral recombinase family protein [Elizabethkingia anophelis]
MESWLDEIGNEEFYENYQLPDVINDDSKSETDWKESRLGMVTGSNFGKLVVSDKKGGYTLSKGQTAENLIYRIAWERLVKNGNITNGLGRLDISSKEIQHGTDYEGEAIMKYSEITGNKVVSLQEFVKLDEFIGGTPDGFVGNDGIVEVKCPWNGGNHLRTLLTGKIYNSDYEFQVQGYLWITKRNWCDFITYDPDLIEGLQISITRVERDEKMITGIEQVMEQVKAKIREISEDAKLVV